MSSTQTNTLSGTDKTDRKLWKIHGGVHPSFHKEESTRLPIKQAGIPAQLIIPVQQHVGHAAEPRVAKGDKVFKGQLIAEATFAISANVHAPTSGTVTAIKDHLIPHSSGLKDRCIVIDSDGKDDWNDQKYQTWPDFENRDPIELLQRIQQAGIVGLGGAVFPTAVKVAGSNYVKGKNQVETLIVNGAECEPYITCDDLLMREKSTQLVSGIRILQHMVKPQQCLIGIEDNKPQAIARMRKACENDAHIEVVAIPTIYPSGDAKQLTKILTGKEIPPGERSIAHGILMQNVGTMYSIYQAVIEGSPLLSRIVTVTGNGIMQPQNFEVLLGTPFRYLAEQAGGYTKMAEHLIMGGPMMGFTLADDSIPISKASNCALFISNTALNEANSAYHYQPTLPCIRCGKCMDACPAYLLPQQLYWYTRARDFEKVQAHHLNDCIECGCCSYVCPSHISLVDYFRFAKSEIHEQQQAQQKARLSRERHEFLLFRKQREKHEREEKRAAHKAALQKKKEAAQASGTSDASANSKADAIKAALQRAKAKKQAIASQTADNKENIK